MKTTARNTLAGLALAGLTGAAHAIPVSLTEPITSFSSSSGSNAITNSETLFTFDLTNFGYDPTLHAIDSALLSLTFSYSVPGPQTGQNMVLAFAGQPAISGPLSDFNTLSPFALEADDFNQTLGLLTFGLQRVNNSGTVTMQSASLSVEASFQETGNPEDPPADNPSNPTSISEPGTLALLGLGLLGTLLVTRGRLRPRPR